MNPHQTVNRRTGSGEPADVKRSTITITDPIKLLFAILLPPLGVFFEVGFKGHFWLNILLTLLGYIPGIIHAIYVILRH
jgi:uncharacterized membrane protein YqaE (UPF0057 family)